MGSQTKPQQVFLTICAHLLEYLDGTLIINAPFLFLQVNQALVQFLL